MTVTIYHDPDCATSRDVLALIRNGGEEPHIIEYLHAPPSREEFVELLRRMDLPLRAVLRRKGTPYDELGLDDARWDDDQLVELMLRRPVLIDRPIVATPLGVRLCRPSETVLSLLPDPQGGAFRKESGEPVIDDQGRRIERGPWIEGGPNRSGGTSACVAPGWRQQRGRRGVQRHGRLPERSGAMIPAPRCRDPFPWRLDPRGLTTVLTTAWSGMRTLRKTPELLDHDAPVVMAAVVARYPFLREPWRVAEPFSELAPPHRKVGHVLMGVESEVMLEVMDALRVRGILAFPIYDGLIVPASAETLACELMRGAGAELRLKVDRA